MGRNDLCFCGSGLKQKRCHPDIHEDSAVARLLKFYSRLDEDIARFQQGKEGQIICRKGCTGCCSDIVLTTNTEFDLIVYELRKWEPKQLTILFAKTKHAWEMFSEINPDAAEHYSKTRTNDSILFDDIDVALQTIKLPVPCPFLFHDSCSIYPVRPVVCRTHGVTKWGEEEEFRVCEKIKERQDWQMESPEYLTEEMAQFNFAYSKRHNVQLALRNVMLLWAMYRQFIESGYGVGRIPFEEESFSMSYNDYADRMVGYVMQKQGR
jgi:Fe-S-cluster containining protein